MAEQEPVTADDVAAWMRDQVMALPRFYQKHAVRQILGKFGAPFAYRNQNRNLAIATDVLEAFNKLTPDVVWSRKGRFWRRRKDGDPPDAREVKTY